jgi:hypothetical protein
VPLQFRFITRSISVDMARNKFMGSIENDGIDSPKPKVEMDKQISPHKL